MYKLIISQSEADFAAAENLFREYAASLEIDLCFQGFEAELKNIKQMYSAPSGGLILLIHENAAIGCVGVRKLNDACCELKRMWVNPAYQKNGYGIKLLNYSLELAKGLGYQKIKLDTLRTMVSAISIYKKSGFVETSPYYYNPNKDVVFFEKQL